MTPTGSFCLLASCEECGRLHMFRYRLKTLAFVVLVIAIAISIWQNWDAIPGTFYRDERGFSHGTGKGVIKYDNGKPMLKEWYYRGLIYKATWFKPDGAEIATEKYDKASGGIGYYLYPDGTVKAKYRYVYSPPDNMYIADGEAIFYAPDGSIERTERYQDGDVIH